MKNKWKFKYIEVIGSGSSGMVEEIMRGQSGVGGMVSGEKV